MQDSLQQRWLFSAAFVLLVVTAVTGAAFGAKPTLPSAGAMSIHLHAGGLGWITLGVLGVVHGLDASPRHPAVRWVVLVTILGVFAFVAVAGSTHPALVAATGAVATAGLIAVVAGCWPRIIRVHAGIASVGLTLALILLVVGVACGELSAATASVKGHDDITMRFVAGHSAVLAVPYLVLAVMAIVEHSVLPPPTQQLSTAALTQVGLVFASGLMLFTGLATRSFALVEANVPLVIVGSAIFLLRIGPQLFPAGWWRRGDQVWLQVSVLALAADVGLFAHAMVEVGRRRYPSIELVPTWLLFAVDHLTYVAMASAALLGAVSATYGRNRTDSVVACGMVAGLIAAIAAIGMGSTAAAGASTAVLGLAVLTGAATGLLRVRAAALIGRSG